MNRLCSFIALMALFLATSAGAQTNQLFGVTEDELTVIVNGREATGEEKKLHLLELDKMKSETQLKGAPKYTNDNAWNWGDPARTRAVNDYYGIAMT